MIKCPQKPREDLWKSLGQGRRETTLIGGGGGGGGGDVFIESPEYAIFIKLPEFYWMR